MEFFYGKQNLYYVNKVKFVHAVMISNSLLLSLVRSNLGISGDLEQGSEFVNEVIVTLSVNFLFQYFHKIFIESNIELYLAFHSIPRFHSQILFMISNTLFRVRA